MGLQYEGDTLDFSLNGFCGPGESDVPCTPRLVVTALNDLSGPIYLVDQHGNAYATQGNTIIIPKSGGGGGTGINPDVASWADLGALTTVGSDADASVDDYVMWVNKDSNYPLGLQVTQLQLSTTATNIPFTRRPDDYVSQSPHMVWINYA